MTFVKSEFIPESSWGAAELRLEDEHGNRGEVSIPRRRERTYGTRTVEWEDSQVSMNTNVRGEGAEDTLAASEFMYEMGRMAKALDLAFAAEAQTIKEETAKAVEEAKERERRKQEAIQVRCEEVAQFYMQMVRVQREGHSSNAKGELVVDVDETEDGGSVIRPRMYLREGNGNMWDFRADRIAKFEFKDGNRYTEVDFKPIPEELR